MAVYSHNTIYDPVTGQSYDIRGYDNASNAQIAFNTNYANLQLAKQQNDWNLEQWNRENEYNSPSNQLRLMREAGLNPNNFQQGSSSAGHLQSADMSVLGAPSLQSNDAARVQNMLDMANLGLNSVSSGFDVLQKKAGVESLRADIAESQQRQRLANSLYPYQVQAASLGNLETASRTALNDASAGLTRSKQRSEDMFRLPSVGNLLRQGANLDANTKSTVQAMENSVQQLALDKNLQPYKIKEILGHIRNMDASSVSMEQENQFFRRFGMRIDSAPISQLIQLSLSSPEQFNTIVDSFTKNIGNVISGKPIKIGFNNMSFKNPFSGFSLPRIRFTH